MTTGTGERAGTQAPLTPGGEDDQCSAIVAAERGELSEAGLTIKLLSVYFLPVPSVNGGLT